MTKLSVIIIALLLWCPINGFAGMDFSNMQASVAMPAQSDPNEGFYLHMYQRLTKEIKPLLDKVYTESISPERTVVNIDAVKSYINTFTSDKTRASARGQKLQSNIESSLLPLLDDLEKVRKQSDTKEFVDRYKYIYSLITEMQRLAEEPRKRSPGAAVHSYSVVVNKAK